MPPLRIATDIDAEPITIRLDGDLDFETVDQLLSVTQALPTGRTAAFDLRGLTIADSSALHAFAELHERARETGGAVRFIVANPTIVKAFDVVGFLGVLDVVQVDPSAEDADRLDL